VPAIILRLGETFLKERLCYRITVFFFHVVQNICLLVVRQVSDSKSARHGCGELCKRVLRGFNFYGGVGGEGVIKIESMYEVMESIQMQAPKFPCTIHELPKKISLSLRHGHPFEETLFPKNLLVSHENRHIIKEDLNKTCAYLEKWKYDMWQENERMLAGVPCDFRQNGLIRFREKEAQYNKQHEEYIVLAKSVFNGDLPWTDEVKEYVAKKEVEQKAWWEHLLSINYKKCKNCKKLNGRDNKHCVDCGSSLGPPCPPCCGKCKYVYKTGDKYCGECGNKLPLPSVSEV